MASPSRDGNSPYDYFKAGAEVEVSSEDEGFRGSWYLGTIVQPPRSPFNDSTKVLVEYKTLLEDEAAKLPLKEELKLVLLRPLPPRERNGVVKFKLNDEVDAYYSDGWWEGVVTGVDEERERYSVYFRTSREQYAFKASQLRLHREWVGGSWIPPLEIETEARDEKLSPTSEVEAIKYTVVCDFSPGALVEVCSDEEGFFEGSWYPATVVEKTKDGKYVVLYETLRNNDNTGFYREETDNLHMRPRPPDAGSVDPFKVKEIVDALYNDGWWVGEILKVLENDKYVVCFRETGEEIEFSPSDLRVHQDWINGRWVSEAAKECIEANAS